MILESDENLVEDNLASLGTIPPTERFVLGKETRANLYTSDQLESRRFSFRYSIVLPLWRTTCIEKELVAKLAEETEGYA